MDNQSNNVNKNIHEEGALTVVGESERFQPPAEKEQLPSVTDEESAVDVYEGISISTDTEYDDIIEGTFKEIEDEILCLTGDAEEESVNYEYVPDTVIVNEDGLVSRYINDMSATASLEFVPSEYDYTIAPVGMRTVITPKFTVTLDMKANAVDAFIHIIMEKFGISPQFLIDVVQRKDGEVVVTGQLCLINFLCSTSKTKIKSVELASLVQLPSTSYVVVRLDEEDTDAFDECEEQTREIAVSYVSPMTKQFVTLAEPVDFLAQLPYVFVKEYNTHQLLFIFMMSLNKFDFFYFYKESIYLPPYEKNEDASSLFPIFKELTLCYFGRGNRDKLYNAMKLMCIRDNIMLPAAAYLCPIEFLMNAGNEGIKAYITKMFTLKRPVEKDNVNFKKVCKSKTLEELLEAVSMMETSEPYPTSTIGLFANAMQDVAMFKQLAGCSDTALASQLLQEFVQVLYRKEPGALAAILMAHRGNLTPAQKDKAIKVIKKKI